jgi:multidrug resistance efflux pump
MDSRQMTRNLPVKTIKDKLYELVATIKEAQEDVVCSEISADQANEDLAFAQTNSDEAAEIACKAAIKLEEAEEAFSAYVEANL